MTQLQQRLLLLTLLLTATGLSACGNKGPLVPAQEPPARLEPFADTDQATR